MFPTGTQFPRSHLVASTEIGGDSSRVTVALLTGREVVEVGLAAITALAFEVLVTVAMALAVAGLSLGSLDQTATGFAVGIVVEAGGTLVTGSAGEVSEAGTLACDGVALGGLGPGFVAETRPTVGVAVEADVAFVTLLADEAVLTEALARVVAASSFRSDWITVTV